MPAREPQVDEETAGVRRPSVLARAGVCLEESIAYSKKALEAHPADGAVHFNLACAYAQLHARAAGDPARNGTADELKKLSIGALASAIEYRAGCRDVAKQLAERAQDDFRSWRLDPGFQAVLGG